MAASTASPSGLTTARPPKDRVDGPGGVKGKRQPIRAGEESTAAMAIILGQGGLRRRD